MKLSTTTTTVAVFDGLAKRCRQERDTLKARVTAYEADLEAVRRKHVPLIANAALKVGVTEQELKAGIEAGPRLFLKPRTIMLHGIRLGLKKGTGKLTWADNAQLVAKIRKTYNAEQAAVLIITTEEPSKTALAQLPAAELKKLGVVVSGTGDQVLIKDAASDLDKLVVKILEEAGGKAQS